MYKMKTFEDLEFIPHPADVGGKQAVMEFENGFGISVIFGSTFYSDGKNTYEVGILYKGSLCYDSGITDDVIGQVTKEEVNKIMKVVQALHRGVKYENYLYG